MHVANHAGRACLVIDWHPDGTIGLADIEGASDGRFGPDPMTLLEQWEPFTQWGRAAAAKPTHRASNTELSAPIPRPTQVLAVGTNYTDHAAEVGQNPTQAIFSKLPTCIIGPAATVTLPTGTVDWEVELVAVIGRPAFQIPAAEAREYIAGFMVGQDLSERASQFAGELPQFTLAKSRPGFGPTGPWLTTLDELADPTDLAICCQRNGESVQSSRTSAMIQGVDEVVAFISAAVPLLPGDLVFTGTPSGVGYGRDPQLFLVPGDHLTSMIEGLGQIDLDFVAGEERR
jgi:2,4-diketo-3-deoxy-L-fuconate hydrolase